MKNGFRFISLLLCVVLAFSLFSAPAYAAALPDNPSGTTVDSIADGNTMTTNDGTVTSNLGAITTNSGTGTVERNGTVLGSGNRPVARMGTLETNNGTVDYNFGTITTNSDSGTVNTNEGVITTNDGTVIYNHFTADPHIVTNNGTVETNDGTVDTNSSSGMVGVNGGTVEVNNGTVTSNGLLEDDEFHYIDAQGFVETNNGTIAVNITETVPPSSTPTSDVYGVQDNNGVISSNKGRVQNNTGGIINDALHYSGTFIYDDGYAEDWENTYIGVVETNLTTVSPENGSVTRGIVVNQNELAEVISNEGIVVNIEGTVGTNSGVVYQVSDAGVVTLNGEDYDSSATGVSVDGDGHALDASGNPYVTNPGTIYYLVNVEGGAVSGLDTVSLEDAQAFLAALGLESYDGKNAAQLSALQWIKRVGYGDSDSRTLGAVGGCFDSAPVVSNGDGTVSFENGVYILSQVGGVITLTVSIRRDASPSPSPAISYFAIIDLNGGTGAMEPVKIVIGEKFTLPECTLTPPEGMRFAGWRIKDGDDTVYQPGEVIIPTASFHLVPVWEAVA